MRLVQIGAVGTALAYLAISYSQSSSGFPQAAAFMLAILTATLTLGVGAAVGLGAWPGNDGAIPPGQLPAHACHGCGRPMVEIHSVWVCARCDRVH